MEGDIEQSKCSPSWIKLQRCIAINLGRLQYYAYAGAKRGLLPGDRLPGDYHQLTCLNSSLDIGLDGTSNLTGEEMAACRRE